MSCRKCFVVVMAMNIALSSAQRMFYSLGGLFAMRRFVCGCNVEPAIFPMPFSSTGMNEPFV